MSFASLRSISLLVLGLSFVGVGAPAQAYVPTSCDPEPDCIEICYVNSRGALVCNVTCDYGLPCDDGGDDDEGGTGGNGGFSGHCYTDSISGETICPLEG